MARDRGAVASQPVGRLIETHPAYTIELFVHPNVHQPWALLRGRRTDGCLVCTATIPYDEQRPWSVDQSWSAALLKL